METKLCKASLRPAVSPDGETGFFVSAPDYDLEKTFDCGQCFRFARVLDSPYACEYEGVAHGRYVRFASGDGGLYIFGASEDEACAVWTPYLSLDTDYAAIRAQILRDLPFPAMREAVAAAGGIRILRQERFETLCSFILSQNNNIPRIKKIIEALCAYCGAPLDTPRGRRYAFPAAQALARLSENELRALGCGFRARYIADAARRVASGVLELDRLPLSQAGGALCEICGVGEKVSACVRLYGFGDLSAFPVDVWIRRSLQSHFEDGFDAMHAGIYGGVAQQYLFYYERYILAHRKK